MERATGIGGIFFKSKDPAALQRWYQEKLGLHLEDFGGVIFRWGGAGSESGATVWAAFEADSQYFGGNQPYMINYRVRDVEAMLAQLRSAGVEVEEKVEASPEGKFAHARDCDGNRFELWEPPAR
jgi:predicted enzyme related to lactoylglutathione lyase